VTYESDGAIRLTRRCVAALAMAESRGLGAMPARRRLDIAQAKKNPGAVASRFARSRSGRFPAAEFCFAKFATLSDLAGPD
jgi:hypothetical protein